MLKYQLLIYFRNLKKAKTISAINIAGLAIGMAACILIFSFVQFEITYNAQFDNKDRLYRLIWKYGIDKYSTRLQAIAGELAESEIADVTGSTRFFRQNGSVNLVEEPGKAFLEDDILYADPSFFKLFNFQLKDPQVESFSKPFSAVISSETATKYFGDRKALGKSITVSNMFGTNTYTIRNVVVEIPKNSNVAFDILLTNERLFSEELSYMGIPNWGAFETYILTGDPTREGSVQMALNSLLKQLRPDSDEKITLQPMSEIHLYSGYIDGTTDGVIRVYTFTAIAVVILLLAWFNYINLNTSRAFERAKEVGIKKIFGSGNRQILSQFLKETILTNTIALGLAILLSQVFSDLISGLAGIDITWLDSWNIGLLVAFAGMLVLGSFVSGVVPGLIITRFKIMSIMSGKVKYSDRGKSLRRLLVGLQFGITAVLLMITLTIDQQINFMLEKDKGLKITDLLIVQAPGSQGKNYGSKLASFKGRLQQASWFEGLSSSSSVPGVGYNYGSSAKKPEVPDDEAVEINIAQVDGAYASHYQIQILAGDFFNEELNNEGKVVVNASAVERLGYPTLASAVGQQVLIGGQSNEIIGVVEDYNHNSLREPITPIGFTYAEVGNTFSMSLKEGDIDQKLAFVRKEYEAHFPGNPFEYYFLEDVYANHYLSDQQIGNLGLIFTLFALIIAGLGLFGFTSLTVVQKTKEIGIRKALGASSGSIFYKLSYEFIILVLVAGLVFLPLGDYLAGLWLKAFPYQFSPGIWYYVLPTIVLLLITSIALSYHSIKASLTNPVDALRYE